MTDREKAMLARHEMLRKADESRYDKTKQGRFEKSIKPCLVRPDGTDREINDGNRAMERMIRSLDWPYHLARREKAIRRLSAQLKDSTLQRILWAVFKARDQREAIRLARVSERTFYRGVAKICRLAGERGASRRNTKARGLADRLRR